MKRAWVVLGVAGFGADAWAQNVVSDLVVALTFDRTSIGIGETATATMTASWLGPPGSYMSSVTVDLVASGAFVMVSDIAPVAWNNPALGFNGQGVASGADVLWLNASQFNLIPPYTTENPILITTFTVTGAAEGLLWYRSVNSPGAPFPYGVQPVSYTGPVVDWTNDVFESQTLVVTPGPGVVGVLGVVGVVGLRRRRG